MFPRVTSLPSAPYPARIAKRAPNLCIARHAKEPISRAWRAPKISLQGAGFVANLFNRLPSHACIPAEAHRGFASRSSGVTLPLTTRNGSGGLALRLLNIYLMIQAHTEEWRCDWREERLLDPCGMHCGAFPFCLGLYLLTPLFCMLLPTQPPCLTPPRPTMWLRFAD